MWPEIKRKFFHLGGLIYVAGLIYIPRPAYLGLLTAWAFIEGLFEAARLKNPAFNEWIYSRFGGLMRDKERQHISGIFWMILGVLTSVSIARPVPIAAASILYLLLGDGVASLVGKRFGGPAWPRSNKRVSGSLACFLACVVIGKFLLEPLYGWPMVFIGAAAATVLELISTPIDDNLLIPTGTAFVLLLCS